MTIGGFFDSNAVVTVHDIAAGVAEGGFGAVAPFKEIAAANGPITVKGVFTTKR